MAGLLIRELKLRGLVESILIVCPANLTFQWQRELKEKFDEQFLVLKGNNIRDQFGMNQWLEQTRIITSLDLAKRDDILPSLRQELCRLIPPDLPTPEELEEMEESERQRFEEMLDAITLASNAEQIREEVEELKKIRLIIYCPG